MNMTVEIAEKLARTVAETHVAQRAQGGESAWFEGGVIHGLYRAVGIIYGAGAQITIERRADEMLRESGHEPMVR